jgi:hypothetical protein
MVYRRIAVIVALGGFVLATQGSSGCANTETTPTGNSKEAPPGVNQPEQKTTSTPKPQAHTQVFHGIGQRGLGTIVVPVSSTVSWTCPSCATAQEGVGANFIIENASSDGKSFSVNGLKETHGVSPVEPGTYHTVVVNTQAGAWTVRIVPGE